MRPGEEEVAELEDGGEALGPAAEVEDRAKATTGPWPEGERPAGQRDGEDGKDGVRGESDEGKEDCRYGHGFFFGRSSGRRVEACQKKKRSASLFGMKDPEMTPGMARVLELLKQRRWIYTCLRTNIAQPEEIVVSDTGFRKACLASNVLGPRELELREAVKAISPVDWDEDFKILVNKNVTCKPHKDRGNVGASYCLWLGDFKGGALVFDSGRRVEGKNVWHTLDAKEVHWNEPHVLDKYSVIIYRSGVDRPKAKLIEAARRRRLELSELRRANGEAREAKSGRGRRAKESEHALGEAQVPPSPRRDEPRAEAVLL